MNTRTEVDNRIQTLGRWLFGLMMRQRGECQLLDDGLSVQYEPTVPEIVIRREGVVDKTGLAIGAPSDRDLATACEAVKYAQALALLESRRQSLPPLRIGGTVRSQASEHGEVHFERRIGWDWPTWAQEKLGHGHQSIG